MKRTWKARLTHWGTANPGDEAVYITVVITDGAESGREVTVPLPANRIHRWSTELSR